MIPLSIKSIVCPLHGPDDNGCQQRTFSFNRASLIGRLGRGAVGAVFGVVSAIAD